MTTALALLTTRVALFVAQHLPLGISSPATFQKTTFTCSQLLCVKNVDCTKIVNKKPHQHSEAKNTNKINKIKYKIKEIKQNLLNWVN
jgi:hypothetical protein